MKFLIATHNTKKRDELERILAPLGISAVLDREIGLELTDVEETGTTFEENALLKAQSGCDESTMPCIADDSGLSVDALDGEPGIYSARFAGVHGDDDKNIEKLLCTLEDIPQSGRTAKFVSVACCVFPDGRTFISRGECVGTIAFKRKGNGGFGYDSVFLPLEMPGKTMAELTAEEKDKISHRRRALEGLAVQLGSAGGCK